jgi:GTPase SAR1 family protein
MPLVLFFGAVIGARKVKKTLQQALNDKIKFAVDGIIYNLSLPISKTVASALTLRRYCTTQLSGTTQFLSVPGTKDINLPIDNIYIPLSLEKAGDNTTYSHRNILNAGNNIRIIGDPGSGKSSLTKRLFRDECLKAQKLFSHARFPALLELRKLPTIPPKKDLDDWLYDYLLGEVVKYEAYRLKDCFEIYGKTAGLLIILDGLDEIPSVNYPSAEGAIIALAEKLRRLGPNNVLILTMRIQFHVQVRRSYSNSFPSVLSLVPFTPTDTFEFLQRWDFDTKTHFQNIIRIYNDLTDRPTLRDMCSNPLVLSMYVAQDQATGHPLAPESRTEFYSRVTDELLIRRRAVQVGVPSGPTFLREQRQKILDKIALEHLTDSTEPANSMLWRKAVKVVQNVIPGLDHIAAEEKLQEISKDTGLITEERERESLRFIHLTFCEFLAAFEAVQGRPDGWSNLVQRHIQFGADVASRTRLAEVLPFACAMLPRICATKHFLS